MLARDFVLCQEIPVSGRWGQMLQADTGQSPEKIHTGLESGASKRD